MRVVGGSEESYQRWWRLYRVESGALVRYQAVRRGREHSGMARHGMTAHVLDLQRTYVVRTDMGYGCMVSSDLASLCRLGKSSLLPSPSLDLPYQRAFV